MTKTEAIRQLKSQGTPQNCKIYGRHGVQEPMFGVSFGNLEKLKKKVKVDQQLAERLWAAGNHDAKVLATMIADPGQIKSSTLDAWASELGNYVITDAFVNVVSATPFVHNKMKRWIRSRDEWKGQAGWNLVGYLAREDDGLPDSFFEEKLETIEQKIHTSKNRVRHAMNGALINIGIRNGKLHRKAIAAARRIGKVEVDHGQTSCTTPDAIPYMEKALAWKSRRAAGKPRKHGSAKARRRLAEQRKR